jgi:hypothetical protein
MVELVCAVLECDLPPGENGKPRKMEEATHPPGYDLERLPPLPGHGFSNYERILTRRSDSSPRRWSTMFHRKQDRGAKQRHMIRLCDPGLRRCCRGVFEQHMPDNPREVYR